MLYVLLAAVVREMSAAYGEGPGCNTYVFVISRARGEGLHPSLFMLACFFQRGCEEGSWF